MFAVSVRIFGRRTLARECRCVFLALNTGSSCLEVEVDCFITGIGCRRCRTGGWIGFFVIFATFRVIHCLALCWLLLWRSHLTNWRNGLSGVSPCGICKQCRLFWVTIFYLTVVAGMLVHRPHCKFAGLGFALLKLAKLKTIKEMPPSHPQLV